MIFGFNTDVKVGTVVYHVQSEARPKDLLLQSQVFVRGQCIGKYASPFPEEPILLDFAEDGVQQALKAQHRRIVEAARAGTVEQELGGIAPSITDATPMSEVSTPAKVPAPIIPVLPIEAEMAPEYRFVPSPPDPSPAVDCELQVDLQEALAAAVTAVTRPTPAAETAPVLPEAAERIAPPAMPKAPPKGEPLLASPQGLATGSLKIECTDAQWLGEEQSLLLVLQVSRDDAPVDFAALTLRLACGEGRPQYAYSNTDENGSAALAITVEDVPAVDGKLLVQAESDGESATRRFYLSPVPKE